MSELIGLADELDKATRQGLGVDEPEGARFVVLSDTVTKQLADRLRAIGEELRALEQQAKE